MPGKQRTPLIRCKPPVGVGEDGSRVERRAVAEADPRAKAEPPDRRVARRARGAGEARQLAQIAERPGQSLRERLVDLPSDDLGGAVGREERIELHGIGGQRVVKAPALWRLAAAGRLGSAVPPAAGGERQRRARERRRGGAARHLRS
jgi:hypothetical protein